MPIRSGRFKVVAPSNGYVHTIISTGSKGRGGAFYRVLNSGDISFTINYQSQTQPLDTEQSFDFYVEPGEEIGIVIANMNDVVEGIYDFLGDDDGRHLEPVRSGRFRFTSTQKVVDLSNDNNCSAFYRFFNTHTTNDFKIKSNGSYLQANGADLLVKPAMSVDVTPDRGEDLTVDGLGTDVEGIYDFLGGTAK